MRLSGRLWRSQALGNYQLSPIIQMHRLYSGAIATGELYQLFSRWIHQNSFPTYHRLVQRRMATRAIPTVLCMEIHSAPDTEPMDAPARLRVATRTMCAQKIQDTYQYGIREFLRYGHLLCHCARV